MMKKIFILPVCIFLLVSCDKNIKPISRDSIIGKWKLTETLADPGDGGTWQHADSNHPVYLTFNADETLTATPGSPYNAIRYKILSDSTMLFIRTMDTLQMRYVFLQTSLAIYPPCYKACGQKYIAVEN
ncbi:MAG: hypothetical protein JST75_01465 [Bacteroidetes bacterium]|nr:hypothetical protein [Bacteroidota bacterium]